MAEPTSPALLAPDDAARLTEFARACKAAARAVSMYPAAHPAIRHALTRLAETVARATANGAFNLQVRSETLAVDGARLERTDTAVTELAELFRRHLIGGLVLHTGTDAESWRALLQLLARTPEDVRADGGIAKLWATAGGPSIEIQEIDYAEVLRERMMGAAGLEEVISACIKGLATAEWDENARQALAALLGNPEHLAELTARLAQPLATETATARSAAFLTLLRHVAEHLTTAAPELIDPAFKQLASAVGGLGVESVTQLLGQRRSPNAVVGGLNVVGAVVERMTDDHIASLVAGSVIAERGASARLAEAFQALVPEIERKRQLLSLAEQKVADSPLGQDETFEELWTRVENMLTSYSDEKFVSTEYGTELSSARTHAVDIEQVTEDPPERVAEWLGTVGDTALRTLDVQLLLDLLTLESDAARWRDLADTVIGHADDLARAGLHDIAWQLVGPVVREATGAADQTKRDHGQRALERLSRSPLIRQAASGLRSLSEDQLRDFRSLVHAIGPATIPLLAEVLAAEQNPEGRRRLRETLVGFGLRGREAVQQLMNATSWEVRRTAAYLLREFGGTESLADLAPLLNDTEPLVQKEAVQAVALNGNEAAYGMVLRTLQKADARVRDSLAAELRSLRDERAAPLFCYLVKNADRRTQAAVFTSSIELLGSFGGPEAIEALEYALYQGDWWAPLRTRTQRQAAAGALRRIGTSEAREALQRAVTRGPRGVRAVARAQLGGLAGG